MGVGGCLGPKKTKDEIYAKLLTEMHEQARKISYPETTNLDIYQYIKQKIVKKGLLRKFIDNLSSHRHKIIDSFNLNYKLTVQAKQIQRHYAGLIVADSLIQMVSSAIIFEQSRDQIEFKQQRQSNAQSFGKSISKVAQGEATKYLRKFITEKRVDIYEQHNSYYDQLYLRLIWYLFENQKKTHYRLLQSLILFCSKHTGTIGCEHFVWKIIQRLNKNIRSDLYLGESCCLFNMLLQRTRDEASEQLRNQEVLTMVIRTWLKQKQSLEVESAEIQEDCEQIIHIYFHRCISLWYCEFLYQVIFTIYDDLSFGKVQQGLLEILLENILEKEDVKNHFFRGLFNYLLGYLSVTHESFVNQSDKKLFSTSLGLSPQKFRSQYKNIFKDHIKLQCFKLLNSWTLKKYTDINQFCMYNNQSLIFVYLSNSKYYYKNQALMDALINQYFKIVMRLDQENRRLFVERLQQAFRENDYSSIEQELILRLMKQCVHRNVISQKDSYMYLYLTPTSAQYSPELNLQILKMTGYLFESSPFSIEKINEEQKYKICQFLFSLYENIILGIESIEGKFQFVCASLSVIRVLYFRFKENSSFVPISEILSVYVEKVGKDLSLIIESKNMKVESRYMGIYYYEQMIHILQQQSERRLIREQLSEINSSISRQVNAIGAKIELGEKYGKIQHFLSLIKTKYPHQFHFQYECSKQKSQQYKLIFTRVFSSSLLSPAPVNNKFQLLRKTSRDSESFSLQSRNSQAMGKCEKCHSASRGNDFCQCKSKRTKKNWRSSDYSFQQVIDIIKV